MTEATLHIRLPVLLPHVQDERDQCVQRLNEWLLNRKGIEQSHIERENGEAVFVFITMPTSSACWRCAGWPSRPAPQSRIATITS